jgi:luciferase family oxidoreductase group 1
MPLALSVLDQSPISQGMTTGEALGNTIDLARLADRLGFVRYWVAEHHGTSMLAGTSPEILIGPIAAATSRLRVGSGGVMLPHYSPLKVAETFKLLSALHPGRIDLAVGRAAGTDPMTAFALQRDRRHAPPDDFPEQLAELLAYVRDGFPAGHRFARLLTASSNPSRPSPPSNSSNSSNLSNLTSPDPWLLGSSPQSGLWAAELGLPYAFADFIYPGGAAVAKKYRETFVPSDAVSSPRVIVAAWALCAETDDEAERLASSSRMAFAHFLGGDPIQVPPIDTALEFLQAHPESLDGVMRRRRAIIGAPASVRARLEALAADYGADEVMVVTITYEHAARRRSYELLAEEFNLAQ